MARKNQYTLYLDKLEKLVDTTVKSNVKAQDKYIYITAVIGVVMESVPFYYEHAMNGFIVKLRKLQQKYYLEANKLSSATMKKRTMPKKKRC